VLLPSPPGRRCPEGEDEWLGRSIDLEPEDVVHVGIVAPHPVVLATFSRGKREEHAALV